MSSSLSTRLKEPEWLLAACQAALPSWHSVSLHTMSWARLGGGSSSPGLYTVSSTVPLLSPGSAVIKLEVETPRHLFYHYYQVLWIVLV